MIRRVFPAALALAATLSLAPRAEAQINPGIHVAHAAKSFGGVYGAGGSLELSFPLVPVDVFVAGEYFFPDCASGVDCSFWGGSADVHFTLPVPVLTPYGTVGLVMRKTRESDTEVSTGGFGIGAGVNLGAVVLGGYAEVRYEIVDPRDQLVFRVGVRF